MRRSLLALIAVLSAAAACVPARDNPNDSSRRPEALLVVSDWTEFGCGLPPATPPPPGLGAVQTAPMGHCLVLDARGSDDPQGTDTLTYRFTQVHPDEIDEADALPGAFGLDTSNQAGFFRLSEVDRLSFLPGLPYEYWVRISDGSARSDARAVISVTNGRPTLEVGADIVLPQGGFPWLPPGTGHTCEFTSTASDPDGDGTDVLWIDPDGVAVEGLPPSFSFAVSSSAGRYVALASATDGADFSTVRRQVCTVRPPTPWTRAFLGGTATTLSSIDGQRVALPGAAQSADLHAIDGGFVAITSDAASVNVFSWPDLAPVDSAALDYPSSFGFEQVAVRSDPAYSRVWVATYFASAGQASTIEGQSFLVDPSTGALSTGVARTPIQSVALADDEFDRDHLMAQVAFDGSLWVSRTLAHAAWRLSPDGQTVDEIARDGIVAGLDVRQGTSETWIAFAGGTSVATLVVMDGTTLVAEHDLPFSSVSSIAFGSDDRLWVTTPEGIALFEPPPVDAGGEGGKLGGVTPSLTFLRMVASPPMPPEDSHLVFGDTVTGTLWVPELTNGAWLRTRSITPDGEVTEHEVAARVELVDPAGVVAFTYGGALYRGAAPSALGWLSAIDGAQAAYDWETGGVWLANPLTNEFGTVLHYDVNGAFLESIGEVTLDGAVHSMPSPMSVSAAPGGKRLWSLATPGALGGLGLPTRLYAIDLATTPPSAVRIPISNSQTNQMLGIEPLAAINDTARNFAWMFGGQYASLANGTDGTHQPFDDFPDSWDALDGARSFRSNDLCYAVVDPTGPSVRLRRLTPTGVMTEYAVLPAGAITATLVAAAADGTDDVCWYGTEEGGQLTLRALAPNGTPLHSATIPGGATDLLGMTPQAVWLNRNGDVSELTFDGVNTTLPERPVATQAGGPDQAPLFAPW